MSWNGLYIVDLLAISLFAASYIRTCLRKGYRVDFWHAQLLFGCIFPYFIMLPFARSELNAIIVGNDFSKIVAAVPKVFFTVIIGYLAVLLGGVLWRIRVGLGLRRAVIRVLDIGPRFSMMLMSSRNLLVALSTGCFCLQSILLAVYFAHDGFGFDLRAYTFANPGARPYAQMTALSTIVVASHCLARYVDTKERVLLVCTVVLTCGLLFFGQRGNLLGVYVNVGICYIVRLQRKISLWKISGISSVLVGLGLYLGNARAGLYSLREFFASLLFLILYGNNFTDLRDFAWIYADWNHHLWLGRTYLAGLTAFVPRGVSSFRAVWSFGIATGWTVGLDTDLHPGLKPGQFGESYFNFGLIGVIGAGVIFGIILRRVDTDVKLALELPRPSMIKAVSSTMLLTIAACFNGSLALPSFYALCGVYFFSWVFLQVRLLIYPRPALIGRS